MNRDFSGLDFIWTLLLFIHHGKNCLTGYLWGSLVEARGDSLPLTDFNYGLCLNSSRILSLTFI